MCSIYTARATAMKKLIQFNTGREEEYLRLVSAFIRYMNDIPYTKIPRSIILCQLILSLLTKL